MTEPVSQAHIESEILRFSALLESAVQAGKRRGEEAAAADTDFDIAYSKAFLLAKEDKLSDQAAKARAIVLCEHQLRLRNATEALFDSSKEAGRNFRAILDGLRTINANLRPLVTH